MCGFLGMRVRGERRDQVLNGSLKKILLWGIVSKGRMIYIKFYWEINPKPQFSMNYEIRWRNGLYIAVEEIRS